MTDILLIIICITVYLLITTALPLIIIRKKLIAHYRRTISRTSYWHNHQRKVIIMGKIYYLDDLFLDCIVSVGLGFLCGGQGSKILLCNLYAHDFIKHDFFIASSISVGFLILIVTQVMRFETITEELVHFKSLQGEKFDEKSEELKMRREGQHFILNK